MSLKLSGCQLPGGPPLVEGLGGTILFYVTIDLLKHRLFFCDKSGIFTLRHNLNGTGKELTALSSKPSITNFAAVIGEPNAVQKIC